MKIVRSMDNSSNMQVSPYEGILMSEPFKFVVGKTKKELFIHSTLVASQSRALRRLMDGPFIESQQGYVVLADEEVRTIAAFAEFIYKGDYHLSCDELPPDIGNEAHCEGTCSDSVKELGRPVNDHWTVFEKSEEYGYQTPSSKLVNCPNCRRQIQAPVVPIVNTWSMDTDYSQLLIAHAKIFVFADCYGIDALTNLAMQKLHKALCEFRLSRVRVDDILALIRFCYEQPAPEKLRKLVASYSAAIMDSKVSTVLAECFQDVLKESGEFAADIAWFLACRVTGSTKC
ncbi:hypothetical protein E4U28_004718 [Claviceps purpurea]|nr:hypothetical protein E4U28_004718 [Claviceps purpurea]KAG6315790.1 hypothetical protein E4U44_001108 [Claviceps purpurea]